MATAPYHGASVPCPRCKSLVSECRLPPVDKWRCPISAHWAKQKAA